VKQVLGKKKKSEFDIKIVLKIIGAKKIIYQSLEYHILISINYA